MMPSLTPNASSAPVAEPAPNPSHVVVVPIFDTSSAPVRLVIDRLRLPPGHELDEKETRSSTIRLAHAATGRMKEVTIVAGTLKSGRIIENNREVYPVAEIIDIIQSQVLDLPDISLEVSEELQLNNPRLCEAVLRSVFAPRGPGESLEDCMRNAEVVKQAFTLQPSVYAKAECRALKVAQYRRAELQLKLEALQKDADALMPPTQFDDPVVYQSWKMEELELLSNLVDLFGNLPSFSGGFQVKVISGEGLKLDVTPKCSPPIFKKKMVESRVYCTVTILPARPGNMPSPGESEDGIVDRSPAFFSNVVSCIEDADWNSQSPWIPVTSMQDRILIEVWEKTDNAAKVEESEPQPEVVLDSPTKLANMRGIFKKQNAVRRKKIAPWSGDLFLGQVMISFSHIESQALAHGGVQGQSPATSYMLADERGKQGASTVQLQFTCSCERFYRDAPPNKVMLMPPVEEIDTAFDNFVRLAFHAENEALFQLGPQWRQLVCNFGAHYRIRAERGALGIVNVMVGLFQEDARYCIGIVPEWLPVCSAVKDGRLTKNELALHCHICVSLMKPVVHALENFQTLFPGNKPKGAIPRLIELLGLILRWEPDSANIFVPLKRFIQSSCERRLHRHLLKDANDREMELTAQSVLEAVQLARSDILEQSTAFVGAFPDGFNLPQITAPMYYKLVSHYASTFMKENSASSLTKEHADILNEFILLRQDLKELGIEVPDFSIESLFDNYLEQWIGSLAPRMIGWVGSTVGKETWEPLSTQPLVSSSIVDLYVMIGQVVDEVALRLSSFSLKNEYIFKLVDAICKCIRAYVDTVEKLCCQELHKDMAKVHGNYPINSSTFGWSRAVYIQMNNINEIQGEQKKLKCSLLLKWQSYNTSNHEQKQISKGLHMQGDMDMVDKEFTKLEKSVQQVLSELIEATLERTLFQFQDCLPIKDVTNEQGVLSVGEQQQSLVNDLDQHLNVMRASLHPELIQQFLRDLPEALVWCMEGVALNFDDHGIITEVQCRDLGTLQEALNKQFGGLQKTTPFFSKKGSTRLQRILGCRAMDSQKLYDVYWQAWKTYQKNSEHGNTVSPNHSNGHYHTNNGHRAQNLTKSLTNGTNGRNVEGTLTDTQLHVLDYLSVLGCKSDRKSRELVVSHSPIAKSKYMQVELGLGREKTLAAYSCRLSRIIPGLFYITAKRVCFVKSPGVPSEKWSSSFLTFDKIQQIRLAGSDSLVFVPIQGQPIRVSRIPNRDAALAILNQQVAGSGTDLEKSMGLLSFQSYPDGAS